MDNISAVGEAYISRWLMLNRGFLPKDAFERELNELIEAFKPAVDGAWKPHPGYPTADKWLSERATKELGRDCYVVEGEVPETGERVFMIADGINQFVVVSTIAEVPAGVAELKAGINN